MLVVSAAFRALPTHRVVVPPAVVELVPIELVPELVPVVVGVVVELGVELGVVVGVVELLIVECLVGVGWLVPVVVVPAGVIVSCGLAEWRRRLVGGVVVIGGEGAGGGVGDVGE